MPKIGVTRVGGHAVATDGAFGLVVVQADRGVVAVGGQSVPYTVQGGQGLLRRFGQARGCHLLGARGVDRGPLCQAGVRHPAVVG